MIPATQNDADSLIALIDRWQTKKVVVAGDFMLDHYVFGDADRLSPDAPVPVLSVQREEFRPGGSSNVCLDLAALRCQVSCLGVTGGDEAALMLRNRLRDAGCRNDGLVTVTDRPTTVKRNIIGLAQHRHPQKMFRLDIERKAPIPDDAVKALLAAAELLLADASVLCIEDYNKGVLRPDFCQALIALSKSKGVPVLVDPAAITDYRRYRGADCVTPNRSEAAKATGIDPLSPDAPALMAKALIEQLDLQAAVITLDKDGALLMERGGQAAMHPTRARQVYDVTGAGDMVLAMLAGALANGATWSQSVELANIAAGLEVERFGVVPIPLEEVLLSLIDVRRHQIGKVRTASQLATELAAHRSQGRKVAFTNGCFDILHAGHVQYLREARKHGDLLVVGLNSDDSIRRIKGPTRPVNHLEDRLTVLSELQCVDYIVVFEDDTPIKLLEAIWPDVLVKGGDYTLDKVVGADLVERQGGKVALVNLIEGRSTTNIINKVRADAAAT